MNKEYKNLVLGCQNCKKDFIIEPDDFSFYEKMKVPPPTFCPECRMQRRLMFRNERVMYKRDCDLCKKSFISNIALDKPYIVYCPACWYSDKWDALDYGIEYNPIKNFFEQFKELTIKTPQLGKIIDYATVINCDYCNHIGSCKNCTLVFNADYNENVLYSTLITHSRDSMDCYGCDKVELSYEITDGENNSRCYFGKSLVSCIDTIFSRDCTGCTSCFACCNLRNKKYCAFNKQYTKEDYEKFVASYKLDTYLGVQKAVKESEEFFLTLPRRYLYGQKNLNVTGDYVYHSKNAKNCWSGQYFEDCAYCQFTTLASTTGTYDLSEWGNNVENCVDVITVGENASGIKYCFSVWANVRDVEYSLICNSAVRDCFGCNSIRNKQFCILNKQYDKETYFKLREQIIENMNKNPYIDKTGRVFQYGEFLPYDISFYDYNEAFAIQHFPLTKEEALNNGFRWRDVPKSEYETTLVSQDLPDSINDVDDSILKEIIQCAECKRAYKILREELNLLKRFCLPLPRICHDCRHLKRLRKIGRPKLYERTCDKCGDKIKTSYAPNRPEIVYCEKCYQSEVY